jgi:hypothetical protein
MLRRLALELGAIVAVGAIAGSIAARGYLGPRLVHGLARVRPPLLAHGTAVAPPPSEALPEAPLEPEPEPEAPAAAQHDEPVPVAATAAAPLRSALRPALPPRLSRTRQGWRLDLRGLPSVASLTAGLQLRLREASAGGGYIVRRLDQGGVLRATGVTRGDVLVGINGRPLLNADQALDALVAVRTARTVSLRFRRGTGEYVVAAEVLR